MYLVFFYKTDTQHRVVSPYPK